MTLRSFDLYMRAALNSNFYIIFIPGKEFLCFANIAFEFKGGNKFWFF